MQYLLTHLPLVTSIKFVDILTACVFNPLGDCDTAIDQAYNILYSRDLWDDYSELIDVIQQSFSWFLRTGPIRTAIYQTSYPPFFETWDEQCDNVGFNLLGTGKKLTKALRTRLNVLTQELNVALAHWIDEKNYLFSSVVAGPAGISLTKFANQDERYNMHRFCRAGVIEPDRNNDKTWFFNLGSNRDNGPGVSQSNEPTIQAREFASVYGVDPSTCDPSQNTNREFLDTLPCVIAKMVAARTIDGSTAVAAAIPEAVQKTFHPRIAGFQATAEELQYRFQYDPGVPLMQKNLRIMAVGGELTIGVGGNAGGYAASYRAPLHRLLTDAGNNVEWVGTAVSRLHSRSRSF